MTRLSESNLNSREENSESCQLDQEVFKVPIRLDWQVVVGIERPAAARALDPLDVQKKLLAALRLSENMSLMSFAGGKNSKRSFLSLSLCMGPC